VNQPSLALLLAAVFCSISSCGGKNGTAPPETPKPTREPPAAASMNPDVHYYKGTSTTTSPDGKTPYGPPADDIVQRTVDRQAGTIVEDVVMAGRDVPTTMRRKGTTLEFDASDEGGTFSGTLTYSGPEWDSWTYALTVGKTGSISGTGKIVDGTIMTDKMFNGPDGKPVAHISEKLAPATAEEFASEKKRLLAMPAPRH
jgi:hypothetical protein